MCVFFLNEPWQETEYLNQSLVMHEQALWLLLLERPKLHNANQAFITIDIGAESLGDPDAATSTTLLPYIPLYNP